MRTRACERLKLQRMQLIVHFIPNMLHKNMVQEKNYDLRLFEKQRKMYKSVTYFTSSKVVKETLIPSNHKIVHVRLSNWHTKGTILTRKKRHLLVLLNAIVIVPSPR